jgi:hypothetical protein
VVFPFAMLTSICRSIVTICSGLYLLIGMTSFSSKWILSHSTWYKNPRSRHPRLVEPSAPDKELVPGDRVAGLGNFGKPTGEFGTVEQANDEEAIVKWDDDGRILVHQPWLTKM